MFDLVLISCECLFCKFVDSLSAVEGDCDRDEYDVH